MTRTPFGSYGRSTFCSRPRPGPCQNLEFLAAYLDGRLSCAGRARVEGHLARCASCEEAIVASAVFQRKMLALQRRVLKLAAHSTPC